MDELEELARSADVIVLDTALQRPDRMNPKYLMGVGRAEGHNNHGAPEGRDAF